MPESLDDVGVVTVEDFQRIPQPRGDLLGCGARVQTLRGDGVAGRVEHEALDPELAPRPVPGGDAMATLGDARPGFGS